MLLWITLTISPRLDSARGLRVFVSAWSLGSAARALATTCWVDKLAPRSRRREDVRSEHHFQLTGCAYWRRDRSISRSAPSHSNRITVKVPRITALR